MASENYNLNLVKEIENVFDWVKRLEPNLLKDFVTYWSIRKSPSSTATSLIRNIKSESSNSWINIIESNHKFRVQYGEAMANELVNIIELKSLD